MKKEYIKPEMELTLIEAEEMIASSLVKGGQYEEGDGDPLSRGRRGSWGNLWEGEE